MRVEDINSLESEAGVIASLIHRPELYYFADDLTPNHFTNRDNQYLYAAIVDLIQRGIKVIDSYNITEALYSNEATRAFAETIDSDMIDEVIDLSVTIARRTPEEYKLLSSNIMDAAFRRNALVKLKECEDMCYDMSKGDISKAIYDTIDSVMSDYSSIDGITMYKDVVDSCWEEIESRQMSGYSGYTFKFPALNEFATLEKGELFIFAADAKTGKSMMLLNCAVDLMKQGLSVMYLDSELNTRLFTARLIAHLTGIEFKRLTAGRYTQEEKEKIVEAKEWIKKQNFSHLYVPTFDEKTMYAAVKRMKHTVGLDVIIIDYFKSSADGDAFSSYQELGRLTDLFKNKLCGALNIAGLGAAQATAQGKVADSAKIGRNASTIGVITTKTPEEIVADGPDCGNRKLTIILNRNGAQHAPGEYIDLKFDGNHIMYEQAKQHIPETPY